MVDMFNDSMIVTFRNNDTDNYTNYGYDGASFADAMKWVSMLILIGIITFNTLVIVLLLFRQQKRSRMAFFVTNLAIADLAVGIFFVFPEILFNWFQLSWPHRYFCYFYYSYFSIVAYYASTYAIVVLTLDRLYVIKRPLAAAAEGKTYRYGLSMSAWVIGLLLGIQYAVHTSYIDSKCGHAIPYKRGILYFDLIILLVVPLAVIMFCYIMIIHTIWKRDTYGLVLAKSLAAGNCHDVKSKNKVITSAKIKTIKLLFIVVLTYAFCWTPITVAAFMDHYLVLDIYNNASDSETFQGLYVFAPLNSLVNPLVFLIFNRKMFRKRKTKRGICTPSDLNETRLDSLLKNSS